MDLDLDHHGTRLLEWLHSRPDHDRLYSDISEFLGKEGLPEECGRPLVAYLQNQGLVRTATGLDGRPDSMITPEGIARLHQIRDRRQDPALRAHILRRQMLQWLYRQEQSGAAPADWSGFPASGEAYILGEAFTMNEVQRTASYLSNKNLIKGAQNIEEAPPGTVWPRLTEDGHDCVLDYGGNASDYLNPQSKATTNTTYNIGGNSGNIAVGSENFTQNVTTGLDASKLLELAAAVRQALPILGLAQDQHSALEGYAAELHDAASAPQLDKGRLRGLVDAIMAGLTKAATPVATAIATGLGNDAIRAITGH